MCNLCKAVSVVYLFMLWLSFVLSCNESLVSSTFICISVMWVFLLFTGDIEFSCPHQNNAANLAADFSAIKELDSLSNEIVELQR